MKRSKIQLAFDYVYDACRANHQLSWEQQHAADSIMKCHTRDCGFNRMLCTECGYITEHYNSCRNRNCPNCQAILKEIWIDARKSEVIDGAYFHAVFTVPQELNALIYANQKLLYSLMHRCTAETILELSADKKYIGAIPGIIQVLHTWGQKLNYHPHIHCIISGSGLSPEKRLVSRGDSFFLPIYVMSRKFRGKFLANLQSLRDEGKLIYAGKCDPLRNSFSWNEFRDSLYKKDWCPYIKETFNRFGNAIEYLGRYANRIAITNTRIRSVSQDSVVFSAKDYRSGSVSDVKMSTEEFVRRLLMHVLPSGFQKIRYYGILNNRSKKKNLALIFRLQGHQQFKSRYVGMKTAEVMKDAWNYDISECPHCKAHKLVMFARFYPMRC
jgi:hypothetical protein